MMCNEGRFDALPGVMRTTTGRRAVRARILAVAVALPACAMLAGCGQRGPIVPLRPPAAATTARPAPAPVPPPSVSVPNATGEQPAAGPQERPR